MVKLRDMRLSALLRAGLLVVAAAAAGVAYADSSSGSTMSTDDVLNGGYNALGRSMLDQQHTVTQSQQQTLKTAPMATAVGGRQDGVNNVGGQLSATQAQTIPCSTSTTYTFNGAYLYPTACGSGGLAFDWCDRGIHGASCYTCPSSSSGGTTLSGACQRTYFTNYSVSNNSTSGEGEWTWAVSGCTATSCTITVSQSQNQTYANQDDLKAKGEAQDAANQATGGVAAMATTAVNDPNRATQQAAMIGSVNCSTGNVQNYVDTSVIQNCTDAQSFFLALPGACTQSCTSSTSNTKTTTQSCAANDPSTTYYCTKQVPMCSGSWPEHDESCTDDYTMDTKTCHVTPAPTTVVVAKTCPSGYTINSSTGQCDSTATPPGASVAATDPGPGSSYTSGYTCTVSSSNTTSTTYSCARPKVDNCTSSDLTGWTFDHRQTVNGSDGQPLYYIDAYTQNEKWVSNSCPDVTTPPTGTYCYGDQGGATSVDDSGNVSTAPSSGDGCTDSSNKTIGEATYSRSCWVRQRNYVCYKQSEALSNETCTPSSYTGQNPPPDTIADFNCDTTITPGTTTDSADPPERDLPPAKTGYGGDCVSWTATYSGSATENCTTGYATASGTCTETPYTCTATTDSGVCTTQSKSKTCYPGAKVYCDTDPSCTFQSEECANYSVAPSDGNPVQCSQKTQTYTCTTTTNVCSQTQQVCSYGTYNDTQGNNMQQAIGASSEAEEMIDGMKASMAANNTNTFDPTTMRLFDGKFRTCDDPIESTFLTTNCCQKTISDSKHLIGSCSDSERELAQSRMDDAASELTTVCKTKFPFGGCLLSEQYWCAYASLFARLVNEQGKQQLYAMAKNAGTPPSTTSVSFSQYGSEGWQTYAVGDAQVAMYRWSMACEPSTSLAATGYDPSTTNCTGIDSISVASCTAGAGNCGALPARPGVSQDSSSKWTVTAYYVDPSTGTQNLSNNLTMIASKSVANQYNVSFTYTPDAYNGYRTVTGTVTWPIHDSTGTWAASTYIVGKKEFQPFSIALSDTLGSTIPMHVRDVGTTSWTTVNLPTPITTSNFSIQSSPSPVTATGGCDNSTALCQYNIQSYDTVTPRQQLKIETVCSHTWYGAKKCHVVITPDCTGFTLEEFAMLDFSKMDLSEYTDSIAERMDAGTHADELQASATDTSTMNQSAVRTDQTIFIINPDTGQMPLAVTMTVEAQVADGTNSGQYLTPVSANIDWGDSTTPTTQTIDGSTNSHLITHTYNTVADTEYQVTGKITYSNSVTMSAVGRVYVKQDTGVTNATRYGGASASNGTYNSCDQSVSDRTPPNGCANNTGSSSGASNTINGLCGAGNGTTTESIPTSTAACTAGTQQVTDGSGTDGAFNWLCLGSNGGPNATCAATKSTATSTSINGVCGTATGTSVTTIPSGSAACASGNESVVDSVGNDGSFDWQCTGINGGTVSNCSATRIVPSDGQCGSANGVTTTSIPTGNAACAMGSQTVTDGVASDGNYNWDCAGTNGGVTASCSAPKNGYVSGACGSANGVPTTSVPTGTQACTTGVESVVDGTGTDGAYDWTCNGASGGTSATCSAPRSTPVNGSCGPAAGTAESTMPSGAAACATGTYEIIDGTADDGSYDWSCNGQNGGTNATCTAPKTGGTAINGQCGAANGVATTSVPSGTQACSVGAESITDGTGSDGTYDWQCAGINGGGVANCSAPVLTPVNGVCGSAEGTVVTSLPSGSAACQAGTETVTDGSGADGTFDWTCDGASGGTNATCSATMSQPPIDGQCGSANGSAPISSLPSATDACMVGTETVTDGVASDGTYNWTCNGLNGGNAASCSAPKVQSIDGKCGPGAGVSTSSIPTGTQACSTGTQNVVDGNGNDGGFDWQCLGSNGGANDSCSAPKAGWVKGVCGPGSGSATKTIPTGSQACTAGSQTVTDSTGSDGTFDWTCSGAGGAPDAICSAPALVPVNGQCGTANGVASGSVPVGAQACAAGNQNVTDGTASDGTFNWDCTGLNGGTSQSCAAPYVPVVNGQCGSAAGVTASSVPTGTAACAVGTETVTDASGTDGQFNWTCTGSFTGSVAQCEAPYAAAVNGQCGSANGTTVTSVPSGSAACAVGSETVTDSTGSDGSFNWTCSGSNGGSNASCSASKTPPVNGQCGSANGTVSPTPPSASAACSVGSVNMTDSVGSDGTFNWQCLGSNGGSNASCSQINGVMPDVGATFTGTRTFVLLWYSDKLTWNWPNATSCTASGAWSGTKATSGSQTLTAALGSTTTYTLTCSNAYGSASKSVTLTK